MSWNISRSKPVSLDYTSRYWNYTAAEPYFVFLDNVRDSSGLEDWLNHLSEKVWFDKQDFLRVREQALKVGL